MLRETSVYGGKAAKKEQHDEVDGRRPGDSYAGYSTSGSGSTGGYGHPRRVLSWAWERHHNILSWYVRPLFILPLAYFSYKRSLFGIVLKFVALATSIFWFPAPARVDPKIEEFLAFERVWLTGEWTAEKTVSSLGVPLILGLLCLAFWRRSLCGAWSSSMPSP